MIGRFFRRHFWEPLKAQLVQGASPRDLALSCALGLALGVFPILGSTTLLCFVAALLLRLNQPAIQAANYAAYPLQLILLPAFVRMGESMFGAAHVPLMPQEVVRDFAAGPAAFLKAYGKAGLYGIAAWSAAAPLAGLVVFGILYKLFRSMAVLWKPPQPFPDNNTENQPR